MNKERKVIEPNAIIVFDRDVNSSELVKLPANFQGDIVIKGVLVFEELYTIKCDNLYANRVVADDDTQVYVRGNLYVERDINVFAIKVNGSTCCGSNFNSTNVIIAGDFEVEGEVDANNNNIFVGGDFTCKKSIDNVDSLKVLGKLKVDGTLNDVTDICIG